MTEANTLFSAILGLLSCLLVSMSIEFSYFYCFVRVQYVWSRLSRRTESRRRSDLIAPMTTEQVEA